MCESRACLPMPLTVVLLALCLVGIAVAGSASAQSASFEWHVCPAGPPSCDFDEVQDAVDAALDGDRIKIAEGVYTDVHVRHGITQVVYVDKPVGLYGGYTTANWNTPDPDAHPSVLDAGGQGRVIVISDTQQVTVHGLKITGGNAQGLGGGPLADDDAGGGVYVRALSVTLSYNEVYSNFARTDWWPCGYGGGIYVRSSDHALLEGNTVHHNTGNTIDCGFGGGLHLDRSHHVQVRDNLIHDNQATRFNGFGGGLYVSDCDYATLEDNIVRDNFTSSGADAHGGGIYLQYCHHAVVRGNTVSGNVASQPTWGYGGGMYLHGGIDITLQDNVISGNTAASNPTASGWGGGMYLLYVEPTLINTVVIGNQANTAGSGLYVSGSSPRLLHSTIAENGGPGGGLFADVSPWGSSYSDVVMTNTVVVSHTVGVTVTQGSTVTLNATLWQANDVDWGGAGAFFHSGDRTGDPAFETDGYHLRAASAAIDRGVDAGVTVDIDGEARPAKAAYDLGADEYTGGATVYLPLILRSTQ